MFCCACPIPGMIKTVEYGKEYVEYRICWLKSQHELSLLVRKREHLFDAENGAGLARKKMHKQTND